ncbi:MAG: hypothetical protein R2710_07810 [Acidimicrobiales bacterium]
MAQVAREVSPDVVFSHRRDDVHQDHHTLAGLTWNHFRNHLVLEYEIAKYEETSASPTSSSHSTPTWSRRRSPSSITTSAPSRTRPGSAPTPSVG